MDRIETPRGFIESVNGCSVKLTWNPGFGAMWTEKFTAAQAFLDQAVLQTCEPYLPMQTSMLIKSGILGTHIGMGEVSWIVPYAKPQYYDFGDMRSYDPKRGGYWFPRMWADHGEEITEGTKERIR